VDVSLPRRTILAWAGVLCLALPSGAVSGSVHTDVPASIDPAARYLIYLHGRILEVQGRQAVSPDFGKYEYDAILKALADKGLVVISDLRGPDTDASYANKVAAQVRRLEAAGVPAKHITVAGFSKGGFLARATAAGLADPAVNFVLLAACGPRADPGRAATLKGRILSVYDESDEMAGSCQRLFAPGMQTKEVKLTTGLRHGVFFRPRPDWIDLVAGWALRP
jgi:dienelactone hydrolase